jgi:diguanylate cyclase (GGDEF)-like protein/PAS domain S-box-containing protein
MGESRQGSSSIDAEHRTNGSHISSPYDFWALFQALPDACLLVEQPQGKILDVNDAAIRLYGCSRDELLQMCYPELLAEGGEHQDHLATERFSCQQHRKKDGSIFPVEVAANTFLFHRQSVVFHAIRDVTEGMRLERSLRAENARLKFLAYHDALTGLPNRLLLQDRLEHALAIAERMEHQVALLYIDVDNFKNINDTFGHEAGDHLLCQVAERLGTGLRKADTLGRMAGDEFLVLLENVTGTEQVTKVIRKIRKSLAGGFQIKDQHLQITVSIGGSLFPLHARDAGGLLQLADQELLLAKQQRKGSCRLGAQSLANVVR